MPAVNRRVLSDGDDRFRRMNTRLRPSQLLPGEVALSQNGRMDVDGAWKTREGYENVSGVTLSTANATITVDEDQDGALFLIDDVSISGGGVASNVVELTTASPHGLPSTHTCVINISGLTFTGVDPNGNREVTRSGASTFTYPLTTPNEFYAGTAFAKSFHLTSDVVAIYGACKYSDPSDENEEYIIIADNTQATAIKVSDKSKTNIAYPASATIGQRVNLVQELNTVVLRQPGVTSWEWDGDLGGGLAFVAVSSGAKTQPAELQDTTTTITTDGKVAMGVTAHGLSTGSKITIIDKGSTELVEGDEYIVTKTDDDNFYFYADIDDTGTGGTVTVRGKVSLGGGYVNMPASPWGIYHQRRSWLPYFYDSAGSPADRNVRDEIIASDILDNKTYDPIGNQYRISGGSADFLVALHGFDDDRLIAFNRNSIHYLKGVSGSLGDVSTIKLTDEIGCLARKSVVSYAGQIFFLSDSGVYSVSFLDEYNLRGTDLPLSEAIDSLIKRINKSAADKSIGVYHENHYWLAVPLDTSTVNNVILVYSFLTKGWVSLDTTNASNWGVEEFIQARAGKVNELYAVTTLGGVHKLDGTGRDKDLIANTVGQSADSVLPIPAELKTRQYTFGSLDQKKFNKLRVHLKSDDNYISQGDLSVLVEDIDTTIDLGEVRDEFSGGLSSGEDGTIEKRIGNPRGFAAQLRFVVESGLPSVRASQMKATGTMGSTTSTN